MLPKCPNSLSHLFEVFPPLFLFEISIGYFLPCSLSLLFPNVKEFYTDGQMNLCSWTDDIIPFCGQVWERFVWKSITRKPSHFFLHAWQIIQVYKMKGLAVGGLAFTSDMHKEMGGSLRNACACRHSTCPLTHSSFIRGNFINCLGLFSTS